MTYMTNVSGYRIFSNILTLNRGTHFLESILKMK